MTRAYEKWDSSDRFGASNNGPGSVNGPIRTRKLAAEVGSSFNNVGLGEGSLSLKLRPLGPLLPVLCPN